MGKIANELRNSLMSVDPNPLTYARSSTIILEVEKMEENAIKTEANRKESCDFRVNYDGREWHITMCWLTTGGEVCWYEGTTHKNGVPFHRTFSPAQVQSPPVVQGK